MKFNTNIAQGIRVPLREIHEIEFSSRCNLACKYCPHPKMSRAKADMTAETFHRTMMHVTHLCQAGTQGEVSLTGIGEAILHPEFVPWMHWLREVIGPRRKLVVATNGVSMTPELARELSSARAQVFVSTHRPEKAGRAVEMLKSAGCIIGINTAFVDSAMDWAGQVDWYVSMSISVCTYLQKGWGAVRQDGSVNTCCMDAESAHPVGHVSDDVGTLETHVTPLCAECNLVVPLELREEQVWPLELVRAVDEQRRLAQASKEFAQRDKAIA